MNYDDIAVASGGGGVAVGVLVRYLFDRWMARQAVQEQRTEEKLEKLRAEKEAERDAKLDRMVSSVDATRGEVAGVGSQVSRLAEQHQALAGLFERAQEAQGRENVALKERIDEGLRDHKEQIERLQAFRVATETRAADSSHRARTEERLADAIEALAAKRRARR